MAALVETIGFVSSTLGIVQFLQSLFPSGDSDSGTTVRIKAGLGDHDSSELGGKIASVYGFDINNDYLGSSKADSFGAGDSKDFTIEQSNPGRRADFISVANSDDAVCIEWISVTMYDGSKGGAWTGDIGKSCGQPWYYGNQIAGELPKGGGSYMPYCTWLDGDGTNGIPSASLKFTTDAYGANVQQTHANSEDCSATIFNKSNGPISGLPAGTTTTSKRNANHRTRPASTENRLIVSKNPKHTAEYLCKHPNSLGPDLIGSEGNFCDMATKTLSPLCSKHQEDGCVEIAGDGTLTKRTSVAKRSVNLVHKSYGKISHWD